MTLRKVTPGSRMPRISARWLNEVSDSANASKNNRLRQVPGTASDGGGSPVTVLIKNTTESSIGRFRPLDITGALFTDSTATAQYKNQVVLTGGVGAGKRFVITQEPILAGKIGTAICLGVTQAYITGEASDTLTSASGTLRSGAGYASKVYIPSGSSERLGVVILASGGCGNNWYFSAEGYPASGEAEFDVTVNGVTESITFPCPCSIAQTRTALESHSEIAPEDLTIIGGTLPDVSQRITFANAPTFALLLNSLTRSWTAPPAYYWDPC